VPLNVSLSRIRVPDRDRGVPESETGRPSALSRPGTRSVKAGTTEIDHLASRLQAREAVRRV